MTVYGVRSCVTVAANLLGENVLKTLNAQQKKVACIALAILGSIATAYAVYYYLLKDRVKKKEKDEIQLNPVNDKKLSEKPIVDPANAVPPLDKKNTQFDATIPVVDMNDYYDPQLREKFIKELSIAFQEVGFVAVMNPGVDEASLNQAYQAAEVFFKLDLEMKNKINDPRNNGQRGYVPGEAAKGKAKGDHKEFLHIGRELTEEQKARLFYPPNLWPDNMDLKTPMMDLFDNLQKHIDPIQRAMAAAISMPEDFFIDMTKEGDLLLRAIHYPPNPPEGQDWAGEHTDIDFFTILPKSTAEGLELKNKNGEWVPVKVPDGAFIINCGDMMQHITNGYFRSGPHRVRASEEGKERFSMVFFVHPRLEDRLDPLPNCVKLTGGIQKYPSETTKFLLLAERLTDLGLASPEMIQDLGKSALVDRLLHYNCDVSSKVLKTLIDANVASQVVLDEWKKREQLQNQNV